MRDSSDAEIQARLKQGGIHLKAMKPHDFRNRVQSLSVSVHAMQGEQTREENQTQTLSKSVSKA